MSHEIYLTPTKIKNSNPGNIAKNIDPIEFAAGKQSPILRNPLIDMTLYKNNTIDSFATGFERTFKLCKEAGIKWEYENTKTSFSFTFIRSNDTANDTTNDTIKNRQSDIISLIKKTPSITRKEIAQTLNISEPTVARDLKMHARNWCHQKKWAKQNRLLGDTKRWQIKNLKTLKNLLKDSLEMVLLLSDPKMFKFLQYQQNKKRGKTLRLYNDYLFFYSMEPPHDLVTCFPFNSSFETYSKNN